MVVVVVVVVVVVSLTKVVVVGKKGDVVVVVVVLSWAKASVTMLDKTSEKPKNINSILRIRTFLPDIPQNHTIPRNKRLS